MSTIQSAVVSWPAAVVALIGLLTIITQNYFAHQHEKSEAVELLEMRKRIDESHALLNSGQRVHLATIVRLWTRLAEAGKPEDIEALKDAEEMLRLHDTKQAVADGIIVGMAKAQR